MTEGSLEALESILEQRADEICAVIIEPLVQAAAGMLVAPPGYLRRTRELCDRHGVLLICDEVATGVGRTGTFFACEQEDVVPDLLVCGKGLSGGYLPIAATITTQDVYDAFLGPYDEFKTFFHGHTYTGNALACAAALANLELMEERDTLAGVREREAVLAKLLSLALDDHPHVAEVRQRGMMIGIELVADKGTRTSYPAGDRIGHRVICHAREQGVIIRPLGDVIVLMPPLAMAISDLERLVAVDASGHRPGDAVMSSLDWVRGELTAWEDAGLLRVPRVVETASAPEVEIDGRSRRPALLEQLPRARRRRARPFGRGVGRAPVGGRYRAHHGSYREPPASTASSSGLSPIFEATRRRGAVLVRVPRERRAS